METLLALLGLSMSIGVISSTASLLFRTRSLIRDTEKAKKISVEILNTIKTLTLSVKVRDDEYQEEIMNQLIERLIEQILVEFPDDDVKNFYLRKEAILTKKLADNILTNNHRELMLSEEQLEKLSEAISQKTIKALEKR